MICAAEIAAALGGRPNGAAGHFQAKCPAHDDSTPSLTVSDGDRCTVVHCHAGCSQDAVLDALTDRGIDLRRTPAPFTVAEFAGAKRLDVQLLREYRVQDATLDGGQAVVGFDYADQDGRTAGTKYRRRLSGDRGFFWAKGSKPSLYGLWRLRDMLAADKRIVLVEGESDCLTLWAHGFTSLGLPGASMWREAWLSQLPEDASVYVVVEPDAGGAAVEKWLGKSELRRRAALVRMPAETKDVSALHIANPALFVDHMEAMIADAERPTDAQQATGPRLFRPLADIVAERREPEWLPGLRKILERKTVAVIAGQRSTFKSFIAHHWVMTAAKQGAGVAILSGEGAGLDRRTDAWLRRHAPGTDVRELRVQALERPVNLNNAEMLAEICADLSAPPWVPDLVVIDTLSKYAPGMDENSNTEVAAFLHRLAVEIRDRFGCTVVLVVHAGHGDKGRPRGASALMANPDAEYIVERPDPRGMLVTVSRERFKDSPALPVLAYTAEAIDLGRCDKYSDPVTSLALVESEAPVVTLTPTLKGKAQRQLLAALRARKDGVEKIWTLADLRLVGREAGLGKATAYSAAEALAMSPFMVATVGGYRLQNG